jgi:SHS2 domain-containing protein
MNNSERIDFEILEHTADVGIRAYGLDLRQAFVNAARGVFSLITDLDSIREIESRELDIRAPDRELLLVEWLSELIYLFDTQQLLFRRFIIKDMTDTAIKAECTGEKVDPFRHELKIGIKAVTYHMLKIESLPGGAGFQVQVLLDI